MADEQLSWFSGLKFGERQAMREREALLDRLSATAEERSPMRVALLLGEAEGALTEAATLAYELGAAGQIVWLYTKGPLPAGIPADFHERVRHINPETGRPLVEQVPPADLFLTPDPVLLAPFYRAERPLLYWHRPGTALPSGWSTLPARILTAGQAGMTLDGRRAFPVAPGTAGWVSALAAGLAVVGKDPLRKRRPRLSLCMIVKNEEKHLQNCLLSVYGLVDEICIVDTGSTDRTVQIAERLGARVEHRVWRDDFAWARNESLAMATGDWILHLDADEVLTPEARPELLQLLHRTEFLGYQVPIDSDLPSGTGRSFGLRLFRRRPDIRYEGIIHENVGGSIGRLKGKIFVSSCVVRHYGYAEDPMLATGKRSRNKELLLKGLEAEPESTWYTYYLGVEEYLSGNPVEALQLMERVPFAPWWFDGEPALLLAGILRQLGREREVLEVIRQGVATYPMSAKLRMAMAQTAYGLGELALVEEAAAWLSDPTVPRVGDQNAAQSGAYFRGLLSTDAEVKERYLKQALPLSSATRALIRHWIRTEGVAEAIRRTRSLELPDRFPLLCQALTDLQDWTHVAMLLETYPELRNTPIAGSLYLAQGKPEEALTAWQAGSREGWVRYASTVALMGGRGLLARAEPHLSPLEWLAVQDVVANQVTWRWTVILPFVCAVNNPNLLEQLMSRAPFLSEPLLSHMRLNLLA